MKKRYIGIVWFSIILLAGCDKQLAFVNENSAEAGEEILVAEELTVKRPSEVSIEESAHEGSLVETHVEEEENQGKTLTEQESIPTENPEKKVIEWDEGWPYAEYSVLHDDAVTWYSSTAKEKKDITVAVNAGHGTEGGNLVKTLCHPDGSPKVTGGSTAKGAIMAGGVSRGTTMLDGTREGVVTLSLALLVKEELLTRGFDVLMIRETEDVQLDNIARTVFSNNNADCHIALHYNSTDYDAGFFYIGVPEVDTYRAMEPVASHWEEHTRLGEALLKGIRNDGIKIWEEGVMMVDLTQTSYSTIPSVDVEVGDRGSDYSCETQQRLADAIADGLELFFE